MQSKEEYRLARNKQIDEVFMDVAISLASLSHAKRAKVAALIVSDDKNILSFGYNGTPSGFDNTAEDLLEDGSLITKPETLHSESNAIAKIAKSTNSSDGATMYVTLSPCLECCKLIIQCGIKKVIYLDEYRKIDGLDLLRQCNIEVVKLNPYKHGRT
jgi:dCMP deaminase